MGDYYGPHRVNPGFKIYYAQCMPNNACHRHHLLLLGAHHQIRAWCKISVRSLMRSFKQRRKKCKKGKKLCLIMLIIPLYYKVLAKLFLIFKQIYLKHILSKFQVVQITASLPTQCENPPKMLKNDVSKKQGYGPYYTTRTRFFVHADFARFQMILNFYINEIS